MEIRLISIKETPGEHLETEKSLLEKVSYIFHLENVKIKDFSRSPGLTKKEALEREEAEVVKNLDGQYLIVAVDAAGKKMDSAEFSEIINNAVKNWQNKIIFIFGGKYGIAEKILRKADMVIAASNFKSDPVIEKFIILDQLSKIKI